MKALKSIFSGIIILLILSITISCDAKVAKSKSSETVTLKLGSYSKIQFDGGYEVVLIQGDEESITIEANKDIIGSIKTSIENNKLHVYYDKDVQHNKILVTLKFKNIDELEINGAASLKCHQSLNLTSLKLHVAGGATITLPVNIENIELVLDGGTNVDLTGKAVKANFKLNGAGKIDAENLLAENLKVEIAGAGYARVNASKEINAIVSGVGAIEYSGNPAKVKSEVNGIGSVKEKD